MDFFDGLGSLFSSPSRGRRRTPQEENARGVALYVLPTVVVGAVILGVPAIVTLGVLPFLALGLIDSVGPRFGLDTGRSRRLAFKSAWVCLVVGLLCYFLKQPLFC